MEEEVQKPKRGRPRVKKQSSELAPPKPMKVIKATGKKTSSIPKKTKDQNPVQLSIASYGRKTQSDEFEQEKLENQLYEKQLHDDTHEKHEKQEKKDKKDKKDKHEKHEKQEKHEKHEKHEKQEKQEKKDKQEKQEKQENREKHEKQEKQKQEEKHEKHEKHE